MASFDQTTGAELWTRCAAPGANRFIRGADGERIYVTEQPVRPDGGPLGPPTLVAVDAIDGTEQWQRPLSELVTIPPGPLPTGGVIVVGLWAGGGGELVAIEAATGATTWSVPTDQHDQLVAVSNEVAIVDGGIPPEQTVITADENGQFQPPATRLTGYDPLTGTVMWTSDVPLDNNSSYRRSAASDGETVVIGAPATVAIAATTGEQRWTLTAEHGDAEIGGITDGVVIIGGQDDDVTALSLETGEVVWTRPGSPPYDDVWAIADGAIYLKDGDDIVAYSATDGGERWRMPIDPETYAQPWMAEHGSLYTMWWNLEARSTSSGTIRWATSHPTGLQPVDDTPRMISVARAGDSVLVTYITGATGGD